MNDNYALSATICEKGTNKEPNRVIWLPTTSESLKKVFDDVGVTAETIDKFHFRTISMEGIDVREFDSYIPQGLELTAINELNYLAAEIGSLDRTEKEKLLAIFYLMEERPDAAAFKDIEFENIGSIVSVIHNMHKYVYYPNVYDTEALGQAVIDEIEKSNYAISAELENVLMYVDRDSYALSIIEAQSGEFLSSGYIGHKDFQPIPYLESGIPEEYRIWDEIMAYMRPGTLTYSYFEAKTTDSIIDTFCSNSEIYCVAEKIAAYIGNNSVNTVGEYAVQIVTAQTQGLNNLIHMAEEQKIKANPNLLNHHSSQTRAEREEVILPTELALQIYLPRLLSKQLDSDLSHGFDEQSRVLIKSALEQYPIEFQSDKALCNMLLYRLTYEEIARVYSGIADKVFLHDATPEERKAFNMLSTDQQALLEMKCEHLRQKMFVSIETAKSIIPVYDEHIKRRVGELSLNRSHTTEKKPSITEQIKMYKPAVASNVPQDRDRKKDTQEH